jgi:hypothetical protein
MMNATKITKDERPSLLAAVALLTDFPAQRLARGQVGTIVEQLDDKTSLVEFSDDQGRAYAVAPCPARGAAGPALRPGSGLSNHWRNSATTGGRCDGFRDGVRELVLAKRL